MGAPVITNCNEVLKKVLKNFPKEPVVEDEDKFRKTSDTEEEVAEVEMKNEGGRCASQPWILPPVPVTTLSF